MSKKQDDYENDPISSLKKERDKLQKRYDSMRLGATSAVGRFGLWGVAGTAAFLADMTFLGGLGTVLAIGSGASFFHNNNQARKMGKQLKQMEESILRLEEAQAIEQIKNQEKFKNKDLNAEFSPAAQKQIADLQKQLAEITKKLDDLQDPPPLDKPKRPLG